MAVGWSIRQSAKFNSPPNFPAIRYLAFTFRAAEIPNLDLLSACTHLLTDIYMYRQRLITKGWGVGFGSSSVDNNAGRIVVVGLIG